MDKGTQDRDAQDRDAQNTTISLLKQLSYDQLLNKDFVSGYLTAKLGITHAVDIGEFHTDVTKNIVVSVKMADVIPVCCCQVSVLN